MPRERLITSQKNRFMKANLLKKIIRLLGYEIRKCFSADNDEKCITIKPKEKAAGKALLSYILEPFILKAGETIPNSHTHYWESYTIGRILVDMGYELDVISYRNSTFRPQKQYDIFIGARVNFDKIAKYINEDCIKVAYLDTAHWLFNNQAAYGRLYDLLKRRGVSLDSVRTINMNRAIESADCGTILGNEFTYGTYQFANKEIFKLPISTCGTYDFPTEKNIEMCRKNFLWFGSGGFVHKGLDLALEVFSSMPDYHLYVCGPNDGELHFRDAYHRELYHTPNIHTLGWVDVDGEDFLKLSNKCLALVYPSCAEGGGGCVIQCMHAGIIPIINYESSVDIDDKYCVFLKTCSKADIKASVIDLANRPADELMLMTKNAWEFARRNHSKERFVQVASDSLRKIIKRYKK